MLDMAFLVRTFSWEISAIENSASPLPLLRPDMLDGGGDILAVVVVLMLSLFICFYKGTQGLQSCRAVALYETRVAFYCQALLLLFFVCVYFIKPPNDETTLFHESVLYVQVYNLFRVNCNRYGIIWHPYRKYPGNKCLFNSCLFNS